MRFDWARPHWNPKAGVVTIEFVRIASEKAHESNPAKLNRQGRPATGHLFEMPPSMEDLPPLEHVASLKVKFSGTAAHGDWTASEVALSDPTGVSPTVLTRFAWSEWIGAARAFGQGGGADVFAEVNDLQKTNQKRAKRPGRKGHPDEHYRHVAALYKQAQLSGLRPLQRIMQEMHVSRPTANDWVKGARRRGHLPSARGSKVDGK